MLINCAAYEDGIKLADIPAQDISHYITRPRAFVWMALWDASDDEFLEIQQQFGLHELAVEDARNGHQRPKIEEYGNSLFTVIQLPELDADGEIHIAEVDIFVGQNYVVSIRNRSTQHFLGVRARCEREPHLLKQGSSFVFYALMDAVVDRYFPLLEMLEAELETIEAQIFEKGVAKTNIERMYALKRKTMVLKHAVAPLMESVSKLHGTRVPMVCANSQEYFRDVSDHLARINASIDTIRDTIGTAVQVNLSMVAIEENETTKRLAAWAGIFAVATAFAGIWGMNFSGMPELQWHYGYPIALGFITTVSSFLYWRFKRAGWL